MQFLRADERSWMELTTIKHLELSREIKFFNDRNILQSNKKGTHSEKPDLTFPLFIQNQ